MGGGYIGLEIGSLLHKLGSEVHILEARDQLLEGVADPDCVAVVQRKLKKSGIQVHFGARAKSYKKSGNSLEVHFEARGRSESLQAHQVLVTVGRRPNSDQKALEKLSLAQDPGGFLQIDSQCRTNIPNIYAIGDITGQPMLAHRASHQGVLVAEVLGGNNRVYDAKTVPAVIFVDPEMASAGWTESECRERGYQDLKIGKFPFGANGKAVSMMETEGFVKIIAEAQSQVVLGVHIVGPEASNLISEGVLALEMGARLEDLALAIHPHPSLGETMMEAAEMALGHGIHSLQKAPRKKSSP